MLESKRFIISKLRDEKKNYYLIMNLTKNKVATRVVSIVIAWFIIVGTWNAV